jgi:uncharacterized protein (DUF736 family)
MLTIGAFGKNNKNALEGRLCGLGIGTLPILFNPNAGKKDNQPDYTLIANPGSEDAYPIGKAWEPREGREHYYVKIESPFLTTPVIKASLFPIKNQPGQFTLVWYSPDDDAPKTVADLKAETGKTAAADKVQGKLPSKSPRRAGIVPAL